MKRINYFLISLLFIPSCYVSKNLEREVYVAINFEFPVHIKNENQRAFSSAYTEAQYMNFFIEGLKSEFSGSNIRINPEEAEFYIIINVLRIREYSNTETVNDTESPDHGSVYDLSSLEIYADGVVQNKNEREIGRWSADKQKSEEITNTRSVGDYMFGSNKDNKSYRKKEFNDDIASDLVQKCGRRSGVRIVKIIAKRI
jgi:hypothetical protein